jgi:hypothetical protein
MPMRWGKVRVGDYTSVWFAKDRASASRRPRILDGRDSRSGVKNPSSRSREGSFVSGSRYFPRDSESSNDGWRERGAQAFSGNRRGQADNEGLDNCVTGLNRVKKIAEDKGVTINVELLNSKVNHKDYQCDHSACGVELCKRVGSPRVKLLSDI